MHWLILSKYAIPPIALLGMVAGIVLAVVWYCILKGTNTPNTGRKPDPLPGRSPWWELPLALGVLLFLVLVIDVVQARTPIKTPDPIFQSQRVAYHGTTPHPGEYMVVVPLPISDGTRVVVQNVPFWVSVKRQGDG